MARDPADVGRAPEDVVVAQVEDPLGRELGAQQVAAGGVLDALRLAGRARSVEQEQRELGVDPHRRALGLLLVDDVGPPQVTAGLHVHLVAGAAEHDHALDARAGAALERLVDLGLELHHAAAAAATVGGDHQARARVDDAVAQRAVREAAEHHGVDRADARAGLHGDHGLGHHRHVDDDAVAAPYSVRVKCIRKTTHFGMQLPVGEGPGISALALEDDGGLVAALREVHVEAVVRGVELAVGEPAEVGGRGFVQRDREGPVPGELAAREVGPEAHGVDAGAVAHGLDLPGRELRARGKGRRRREGAVLLQDGFDVLLAHGATPRHGWRQSTRGPARRRRGRVPPVSYAARRAIRSACRGSIAPKPCRAQNSPISPRAGGRRSRCPRPAGIGAAQWMRVSARAR